MVFYVGGRVLLGLVVGGLRFVINYGHLLSSLLRLEFLSLVTYWWLSVRSAYMGKDLFFPLFYLVIVACERVLGLSLLIRRTSRHGADYIKGYNRLVC